MKYIKTLKIDIDKKNFEVIPSVQYDSNTRFLHIQLLNDSVPFDITGCSVILSGVKEDGNPIFNSCDIINSEIGFIQAEVTEQMNAIPGNIDCEIKIYDGEGVLTSKKFTIKVTASQTSRSVVSSNEFKALTDALNKVQAIDNKAEKAEVEKLSSQLATNSREFNAKINNVVAESEINYAKKSDVARISSGTPLFVASISEMTDNTRNYVNTEDGYLYIYSNESWVKTNVLYQSTGIEEDSVTTAMIKDGVEFNNFYDYYVNCIDGSYINSSGDILGNNQHESASYAKIQVEPLSNYSIYKPSGKYSISSGAILFLNSENGVIDIIDGGSYINGQYNNSNYITLSTPENCSYIAFNIRLTDYDDRFTTIVNKGDEILNEEIQVTKVFGKKIKDEVLNEQFNNFIMSIKTTGKNLYNYDTDFIINKLSNTTGGIQTSTGWGVAKISVASNKTYSLFLPTGNYSSNIGSISFYNGGNLLSYITGSDYISGKYNDVNYITFTTPQNCNLVYVTCIRPLKPIIDDSKGLLIYEGENINSDIVGGYITSINGNPIKQIDDELKHPLKGLKWGFIGDSLTNKNSRALKNYIDYIVEETGIIAVNLGVSGTGYKKTEERGSAFYQRVENIDDDFDIITIFGSGNDLSLTLGNVTDSDTSTVFGCVNETIKRIYAKMPTIKLGIISPTPWVQYPNYTDGNKMQLLNEGLEKICKRGSIPFLDLYNGSSLRPWDEVFRTLMYSRDDGNGVHPDENGHKQIYRKILKFGESL